MLRQPRTSTSSPYLMAGMTCNLNMENVMWNTLDPMVGERIEIATGYDEFEVATVIAVNTRNANIKVRADDGDVLIGNQWDVFE